MTRVPARCRDAHTHLSAGAVERRGLDLTVATTIEDLAGRVREASRRLPPGEWLRGWGWRGELSGDLAAFDGHLAAATGGRAVVLARRDGHAAWLSAQASAALGESGAGLVEDAAYDALRRALPAPGERTADEAIGRRVEAIRGTGVASVDDFVEIWGPAAWARAPLDELDFSVGLWLPASTPAAEAEAIRRAMPPDHPRLAVRGAKIFLDGTLGARTAALSFDYADRPGHAGRLLLSVEELRARAEEWARRGWPVAVHAIGDRAVTAALDVLEALPRPAWGRHRVEHAQVVSRSDLPRFAAAGIVASLQPGHWRDDLPWTRARLGGAAGIVVHPLGSLLRAGAPVVLGSDWPVSSMRPSDLVLSATDPGRGDQAVSAAAAWRLLDAASGPWPA
ncbi:MAG TPA: amidohydrolase family protein [Candidatus Sulfotelmatobacter sp.]|nr:amidohydrolase family protein [Candidatus Sulfotelmatobacter sp.]